MTNAQGVVADAKPRGRRRSRLVGFKSVDFAVRDSLCDLREDPQVRAHHFAALLAFAPGLERQGTTMWIPLEHGRSASWITKVLAPLTPHGDVQLRGAGSNRVVIGLRNSQTALGQFGFRDGLWRFGRSLDALLGLCRGAVHAAGAFSAQGLTIACPSASLMLTLAGAFNQLGIEARPTEGQPRVVVVASDVASALRRLEVDNSVAASYVRLKKAQPTSGSRP